MAKTKEKPCPCKKRPEIKKLDLGRLGIRAGSVEADLAIKLNEVIENGQE
jgi:hypothetical protein